jgi:alkylated DNA repair dioxygenase AlkB
MTSPTFHFACAHLHDASFTTISNTLNAMAKRTLSSFFKSASEKESKKTKSDENPPEPTGPPDKHPSYPIPIPQLPSHIAVSLEQGTPAHSGRSINNQPDLDLLYFQPYITRTTANELFKFLRRELPFYRVQYNIKRDGVETLTNTPRYTTVFGVDETATFIPRNDVKDADADADADAENENENKARQNDIQPPSTETESLILVNTNKTPISPTKYQYTPRPIPTSLSRLQKVVECATGSKYNFCLVNYYASGSDSIAFHSDDERFLGSEPCIASLSLGGEREFTMKHKPPEQCSEGDTGCESHVTRKNGQLKMQLGSGDMVIMRGSTQANWLHSIPKRKSGEGRINITFRRAVVPAGTNNYYNYNVGGGGMYRWDEGRKEMVEQGDRDREEVKQKDKKERGTLDTTYMSWLRQGGVNIASHER